jgi:HNH endonuclease
MSGRELDKVVSITDDPRSPIRGASRVIEVVLTVAHLNHVAGDDRDENLAALCQYCHLMHDAEQHRESRATRKDSARPLLAVG